MREGGRAEVLDPVDTAGARSPVVVRPPVGVEPARLPPGAPVVVRTPDGLGDAVLALPALAAIVERFEDRSVIVAARGPIAPLYAGQRGVSEVVRTGRGAFRQLRSLRRVLAGDGAGLGIVYGGFGAAVALSGAGVREVWGYGGPLSRLALDVALPMRWLEGRHRWEAYALLAAAATGREVHERYPLPSGAGDEAAAVELLPDPAEGPVVGMVVTADPSRRWPVDRFAEVASRLARRGARVVVFGGPGEDPRVAAVVRAADPPPLDRSGRTPLPVLVECLRRLDVLVTNDTGPMHVAAALGTPVVAIFGSSCEVRTGPRGTASDAIVHPVACRPCRRPECAYNHACMTGISVRTVVETVEARLAGRRTAAAP